LSTTAKTKVTKTQLNDLILERLGFAAFLTIHPETKQGLGYTVGPDRTSAGYTHPRGC
jgi:hypothetical protein